MKLSEFDYNLPPSLIAQTPLAPRDHSRLLVYNRGAIQHRHFFNLPEFLQAGDVLVLNDSRVFPARLLGARQQTGGRIEIFLLQDRSAGVWECLVGGPRARIGLQIVFDQGLVGELVERLENSWLVKFNQLGEEMMRIVEQIGQTPIPPYIKTPDSQEIKKEYQTVYARERGSVAAPTAGFHFTTELLAGLANQGVQIEYVTLHVGLGTFAPVKAEQIENHNMHSEYYQVAADVWQRIGRARSAGQRIIAVGTTAMRVLETATATDKLSGWTNIFIYPGYEFKLTSGLLTNFHLPKSTLLMLVAAFLENKGIRNGITEVKKIYQEAIEQQYRFYSFGDAMLVI